jgi:hypothetical protein
LEFIEPLLYLVVLDGLQRDFKASAQNRWHGQTRHFREYGVLDRNSELAS